MSWLRRLIFNWMRKEQELRNGASPGLLRNGDHSPLAVLVQDDANRAVSVTVIRNGFLLIRRTFNPNGPDKIDALYAATAEDLGPTLVAEMAAIRLIK
jgi:hypothetical protein